MVQTSTSRQQPQRGFTKYPNAMFGRFKPSTSYVFLALQSHAGMRDGARPSIGRIASMTGLSKRTVQRAIDELKAAGDLTVQPRGDGTRPNQYGFPNAPYKDKWKFTKFENAWWSLHLTANQAMVLVAINNFTDLEYGAVPGCRTMASMAKVGKDTVLYDVVPALERIGIIEVDHRTWKKRARSNSYSIVAVNITSSDLDVPSVTPLVPVPTPPLVPEMTPPVPNVTSPFVPEMAREEDSSKKTHRNQTDIQEDSSQETDCTPPRLRRDGEDSHRGGVQEKPQQTPSADPGHPVGDVATQPQESTGLSRGLRRTAGTAYTFGGASLAAKLQDVGEPESSVRGEAAIDPGGLAGIPDPADAVSPSACLRRRLMAHR